MIILMIILYMFLVTVLNFFNYTVCLNFEAPTYVPSKMNINCHCVLNDVIVHHSEFIKSYVPINKMFQQLRITCIPYIPVCDRNLKYI